MSGYKFNSAGWIVRLSDGTALNPESNQEYLGWLAAGNTPLPYAAPVVIPVVVSMRQARLALLQRGLLSQVDTAITAMPEPQRSAAKIEWEYSAEVSRDSNLVSNLGAVLGLTTADLDALFTLAATL